MKRSKFSLSNYKLLSMNQGELVPCGIVEVLPGDSIQQATMALVRVSPLIAPMMHPVHVRIHHFFVPHRIVWDDWENFITGGPDGADDSEFPTITMPVSGGATVGSLADYLGVPTGVNSLEVSALPFRGYAKIWNEYFRDADLQTELVVDTGEGPDTTTNTALQNVCWEKDYFTSARPWPQKGPAVTIPLGTTAPVISDDANSPKFSTVSNSVLNRTLQVLGSDNRAQLGGSIITGGAQDLKWGNQTGLLADLSDAAAATVNDFREAMALQRYQEARARFGHRYVDYLAYLGVRSSDARLQRPEYLGGGRQLLQISEVLQTAPTEAGDSTGVGDLAGHGIGAVRSNRYRRFFEEHGYIFTFISVKPKTMYVQGLARTWNRRTKEDFWQVELQHIGQQQVLNKELKASHASPNGVFGYQDRYDEYRRTESSVAGEFRTSTLNYWHMAREFSSDPTLNGDFVKAVPTDRVYAVKTNDVLWIQAHHSIQARRMVARTGSSFVF